MKRFMNKKTAAIGLALGLTLGAAGAAFAYFTSTGTGSGTASVGSSTPFTVTVSSDSSNALLPGSGTETLDYTITNASAGNQQLSNIAVVVGNSGAGDACLGSWFTATNNGSTPTLPTDLAGGASATGTITVSLNDEPVDQDACQGLTTVPVTVNAS